MSDLLEIDIGYGGYENAAAWRPAFKVLYDRSGTVYVRKLYIDLLGDRYRLESSLNREIDRLPEKEKETIRSTFVAGENPADLWTSLLNLTKLVYHELDGQSVPVTQEMLVEYYKALRD